MAKNPTIDWSRHFDAIWCINYIKYDSRRSIMEKELERVGILNSGIFGFEYTMNTPFDMIMFDISRKTLKLNDCDTIAKHSCAFGHYNAIKKSYELGYERILVIEDDVRFLKNLKEIKRIIDGMPDDVDIIQFNPTVMDGELDYYKGLLDGNSEGKPFIDFKKSFYSTGTYSLNRKAMHRIITSFENRISPADWYLCVLDIGDDIRRVFSATALTLQSEFCFSISGRHNHVYTNMGISFDDYNTYEEDNKVNDELMIGRFGGTENDAFFHIIIPTYNIEELIGRCIRSIKDQTFAKYVVTIVDDRSTDGTVKAIEDEIADDARFKLIKSERHVCAGGCRNIALDSGVKSNYTLFIDGDDMYYDGRSLERIFDTIVSIEGDVECVACDYYSETIQKTVKFNNMPIESFLKGTNGFAPWMKCIRSDIVCRFVEQRACYNDVVQHLRQCDAVSKIFYVNTPIIRYCNNNSNSIWNNSENNMSYKRKIALLQLLNDLRKEYYGNEVVNSARTSLIERYEKEATEIIDDYENRQKAISYSVNVQHLNIDNPITFQDKLGFIKTYNFNPLKEKCCDKIRVHEYCEDKLGKDICVPIIKVYNGLNDINVKELPKSFVIKANHGCGYNLVVRDSANLNGFEVYTKLNKWINEDYFRFGYEMQYSKMQKRLFAEEFIGELDSDCDITDYKFFCFNGRPEIFQVASKADGKLVLNFYDENFNFIELSNASHPHNPNIKDTKPKHFEEMREYAKKLSEDFDFVRVDFYEQNDRVYLGEMTFTPGNAAFHYENPQDEIDLGNRLVLDY